jgi:hypothetical protein
MNNRAILHISSCYKRSSRLKDFAVYEIKNSLNAISSINEKGFYKICLLTSNGINHQDEKEKKIDGAALLFEKPYASYSFDLTLIAQQGYACFFTEGFLKNDFCPACIQHSLMPDIESSSIYLLNPKQKDFVAFLFRRMMMEQNTAYVFKDELMRDYIHLIIHEVFKMQASHRVN